MTQEKTYKVSFTYTEGGYYLLKAENPQAAALKLYQLVLEKGINAIEGKYDCTHKEFLTYETEEVQ